MNTAKQILERGVEMLPSAAWMEDIAWKKVGIVGLGLVFSLVVVLMHRKIYAIFVRQSGYRVDFNSVTTARVPGWAGDPVKNSILEDVSGEGDSLLDKHFAEKIARRYKKNPWVRRVLKVKRTYEGVHVRVELRKPVVAVQGEGSSWYLVDREGYRLPGTYRWIPDRFENVYLVTGYRGSPPSPGETWKQARIQSAAKLAHLLKNSDVKDEVNIKKLQVKGNNADWNNGRGEIVLWTAQKVPVHWGRPPGQGGPGEPDPDRKLHNLKRVLRGAPSLIGLKRVKLQYRHPIISGNLK